MSRIALVTGAAQGIGLAIATRLAQGGAAVVLADTQAEVIERRAAELRADGHEVSARAVDVSREMSVQHLVESLRNLSGPIDILVNNAAVNGLRDGQIPPIHETSIDEWTQVIDVNLTGVFLMSRAFTPGMIDNGSGSIINISSAAARTFIPFAPGAYCATKAGVIALTWRLAHELGRHGIRVNGVAPGWIETAMNAGIDRPAGFLERVPLRRAGLAEDVANTVEYLVSDQAAYLTGTTIDVHGGLYMTG